MMESNKEYEGWLDRKCSPIALAATMEICGEQGMYNFRKNDESVYTGHIYDLTARFRGRNGREYDIRFETELKQKWKGLAWSQPIGHPDVPFMYPTIDFPYRKRDKADVHAHYHDIVGESWLFRCHRSVVVQAPVHRKYCDNTGRKEPFFTVPLPAPRSQFWQKVDGVCVLVRKWNADGVLVVDVR